MSGTTHCWSHPDPDLLSLAAPAEGTPDFRVPSYDGSIHPRYRLYPDNDFRPTPWITNHYGWLSAAVRSQKPPHTIRVGIIGDSTSHNFYGLQLQSFSRCLGRTRISTSTLPGTEWRPPGIGHRDEMAVLKYELAPMGLDYVYAYFAPDFAVVRTAGAFATLPQGVVSGHPPPGKPPWRDRLAPACSHPLAPFSALARSMQRAIAQGRPRDACWLSRQSPPSSCGCRAHAETSPVLEEAEKDLYFWRLVEGTGPVSSDSRRSERQPIVSTNGFACGRVWC